MVKREPCRESREEMTEPFVGKKKAVLTQPGKRVLLPKSIVSSIASPLFFVLLLFRIIMRDYFGPFRHPLLFPLL